MDLMDTLGFTLTMLRKQRGIAQADLAASTTLGRAQLSAYEAGRQVPNLNTLLRILDALEISPAAFFRRVEVAHAHDPAAAPQDLRLRELQAAFADLRGALDHFEAAILHRDPPGPEANPAPRGSL